MDGESRAVNVCFPSTKAVCRGTNEGRKLVKESFFDGRNDTNLITATSRAAAAAAAKASRGNVVNGEDRIWRVVEIDRKISGSPSRHGRRLSSSLHRSVFQNRIRIASYIASYGQVTFSCFFFLLLLLFFQ